MNNIILRSLGDGFKDEEIKALRVNIEFSGMDNKVILLTSATPSEGKSHLSLFLAGSLAESGKKVLFIDADMRKSVLRSRMKANGVNYGLSHLLSGKCTLAECLYNTQIENLTVIFAGIVPPNPAELLGQRRFEKLIDVAKENYDYIIVDTPPLGNVIDAAVIAKYCDSAVLVISSGKVSYKYEQTVVSQLQATGISILGVVLNRVKVKDNKRYGHYGKYGKYGKYGDY